MGKRTRHAINEPQIYLVWVSVGKNVFNVLRGLREFRGPSGDQAGQDACARENTPRRVWAATVRRYLTVRASQGCMYA